MFPTGLLIQSLNEMIDNQEKRLTALVGGGSEHRSDRSRVSQGMRCLLLGPTCRSQPTRGSSAIGSEKRPFRCTVYTHARRLQTCPTAKLLAASGT